MLFKIFLLECSWFTMLCLPQVYSKVNQWYICICFHPFLKDSFPIKAITEYWVGFPVLYTHIHTHTHTQREVAQSCAHSYTLMPAPCCLCCCLLTLFPPSFPWEHTPETLEACWHSMPGLPFSEAAPPWELRKTRGGNGHVDVNHTRCDHFPSQVNTDWNPVIFFKLNLSFCLLVPFFLIPDFLLWRLNYMNLLKEKL